MSLISLCECAVAAGVLGLLWRVVEWLVVLGFEGEVGYGELVLELGNMKHTG